MADDGIEADIEGNMAFYLYLKSFLSAMPDRRYMSNMRFRMAMAWCVLPVMPACIVEAPGASSGAPPSMQSRKLPLGQEVAPKPPVGANLGGKVEVSAVKVEPAALYGAGSFTVTTELRVLETFDANWQIFVHVEDARAPQERINADHAPMSPTALWKVGDRFVDVFTVDVPTAAPGQLLNVYYGFWEPQTNARLPIQNPDKVRHDGNNRFLLAQVPVQ